MRSLDWTRTPVGPVNTWPQSLRTALSILLETHFPMYIAWGSQFTQFYNDGYRPILGSIKHPAAMGRSTRETFAEIWDIIGPMFEGVMGGKAVGLTDFMLPLNRHGFVEECYFIFSYSPIRDETGGVGGVLVTVTETTERVYGERRLRTLRALGERTVDSANDGEACRRAAEVLAQNTADLPFSLIYLTEGDGGPARALLAGSAGAFAPGAAAPLVDLAAGATGWPLREVIEDGRPRLVEDLAGRFGAFPAPAEGVLPPRAALVLPMARAGDPRAAGVLVAGISARQQLDDRYRGFLELVASQVTTAVASVRALEEQRRRAEALAELDRAKTAFFSNISHEFRTPLTLMLGPLDDALEALPEAAPPAVARHIDTARRNAARLLKLVNALLDFSRIEAGRMQATFEPTDLGALTTELAGVFRSAIERAGLRLEVRCQPLSEPVYVDREMWEKIVLNLLSNALKFTFEGSITVEVRSVGGQVRLSVRDTGIGVAPEELPRLFERFHRVEGARARTHEGSGIGLALVQELVRMHGGDIRVESAVGAGTTFTVSLAPGSSHLPREQIRDPRPASPTVGVSTYAEVALGWTPHQETAADHHLAPLTPEPGQRAAARILVADDNADMREYLTRLLSPHWEVASVADGQAALTLAARSTFDLVLADVMMPGLDGFALIKRLREDPQRRATPVILLSARAGEESRIDGLRAGADDYLVKPFSARELVARVSSQLALARLRQEIAGERTTFLERELLARGQADLQRENLLSLFMQAPTPIAILAGPEHVVELANEEICRAWRRQHHEVIDKPLFDALPELRDQAFKGLLDDVFRTGVPYVGRRMLTWLDPAGDGRSVDAYFNFVYAPKRAMSGEIEGVLVIAFDVTDEVLAREQLDKLRADAEAANRTKDTFLAMLGHELRNPLSPIKTAVQLLRMRGNDTREVAVIERQVGHLVRLVDDLLDVSRITKGKIELRKEVLEIGKVIVRGVELASPLLEQRKQQLELDVPAAGLVVEGDPDRLGQVVANLLTNAAKYSEPGSKIGVSARVEGSVVRISVRDQGMGIPGELLGQVFDLFVQHPQALDRSHGGLGLGLTIVRSLVELHGGRVSASSGGSGCGSEFVVELPQASRDPASARLVADPAARSRPDLARNRILVVDDNRDAAEMLAELLRALGFAVRIAHDGPSALALAGVLRPNVCLLDIGLPIMDGYELARRLREVEGMPPDVRMVAITGYGQDGDRDRSRDAGFSAHVAKPVDRDLLAKIVSH